MFRDVESGNIAEQDREGSSSRHPQAHWTLVPQFPSL